MGKKTSPTDIRVFGKLPNGATVLSWRWDDEERHKIVLCMSSYDFVTWKLAANGEAYWGHYYYTDLKAAMVDFETRR